MAQQSECKRQMKIYFLRSSNKIATPITGEQGGAPRGSHAAAVAGIASGLRDDPS